MQTYPKTKNQTSLFNELLDIDEVQALQADEMPFVEDFKALLKKHNKLDRFGLTLLHKHFDLEEGEMMVESTDIIKRRQVIEPKRMEELRDLTFVETNWRFDNKGMLLCLTGCMSSPQGHRIAHLPLLKN